MKTKYRKGQKVAKEELLQDGFDLIIDRNDHQIYSDGVIFITVYHGTIIGLNNGGY